MINTWSLRQLLARILSRKGIFFKLYKVTNAERLNWFFSSIKPYATNHGLVRIGGAGDGGYLVPNDLEGVVACFSPGVARTADFELDMVGRGIRCFLADYSVSGPPVSNPDFTFVKKYLGKLNNERYMTLDKWVADSGVGGADLLLQMDIEGAEYEVILSTPVERLRQFRIIVIEFHRLHNLLDPQAYELIASTFARLLTDFEIVHIHPNNIEQPFEYKSLSICPIIEFTFIRRDRVMTKSPAQTFPHPLDRKNSESDDIPLPRCWFDHHPL